jgi:MFS family permease
VAFTIVYVFASLPIGRIADRGHRKVLLIAGASLWCIAAVLCGLAPNFGTLFTGRLLIGIGEAVLVPTAVSMIADSFPPERRGFAIGILSMGTIIGGPLGISVGGILLSVASAGGFHAWPFVGSLAPWRQVLVTIGAAGLVAPLLLATVREPKRLETTLDTSIKAAANHFMVSRRILAPLYISMALLSIGDYGLLSWMPSSLSRRFAWEPGRIGLVFGVITALSGIAGAAVGGWISDVVDRRVGTHGRVLICVAAAAVAAIAAALVSTADVMLVLMSIGLWTFASAVGGTSGVAALQEVLPSRFRATGMSLFTFTNTLVGLGAGPTLIALATDRLFTGPAALSFAISTIVGPAAVVSCAMFAYTFLTLPNLHARRT